MTRNRFAGAGGHEVKFVVTQCVGVPASLDSFAGTFNQSNVFPPGIHSLREMVGWSGGGAR